MAQSFSPTITKDVIPVVSPGKGQRAEGKDVYMCICVSICAASVEVVFVSRGPIDCNGGTGWCLC